MSETQVWMDIKAVTGRFDVLYGARTIQPELACRVSATDSVWVNIGDEPDERTRCTYCGRIEHGDAADQCDGCGAWAKEFA